MGLFRQEIAKNLHYNYLQTDRFKTNYLSINFVMPLEEDTVSYYALLPRVLRCGCATLPNRRAIVKRLEDLYGADIYARHFTRGEHLIVSFAADFLDQAFLPKGETISIFSEIFSLLKNLIVSPVLQNGLFLEDYVNTERQNCINAIRTLINHKQQYALQQCMSYMCKGEPAGISALGYLVDFESVDPQKLLCCYQKMLQSARIEIFYIGAAPSLTIYPYISTLFENIPRIVKNYPSAPRILSAATLRETEEIVTAAQGKLVLGFRAGLYMDDPNQLTFSLFTELYGGAPSSKLFMHVREEKSLCYSCYASADLQKGILYVAAGIDPIQKEVAIQEILLQLDKIRQGDISDEEFQYAQSSLANGYRSLYDSAEGLETWYLRRILANCIISPEEAADHIIHITPGDVARIARGISLDTVYFLRGDENLCEEDDENE